MQIKLLLIKKGLDENSDDISEQQLLENLQESLDLLNEYQENKTKIDTYKNLISGYKKSKNQSNTLFVTFMHKK
jgi:hypothetical protein